uniref:Acetyltransferase At3g50280 family n=1 Tax=Cajanus cajan TaxID=3821 RepID=A0A151TZ89_CAJCA|nr:putative acetyltransferase At3g50280 family [Cajanus cajan]
MSDHSHESSVHGHHAPRSRRSTKEELRELREYIRRKEIENEKNNETIRELLSKLVVGGEANKHHANEGHGPSRPKRHNGEGPFKPHGGQHEEEHSQPKNHHSHTHLSSSEGFYSSHNDDGYYQRPPRQHRLRHEITSLREPRVDLPPFHGKDNVDDYLDWEMKVEQLFTCHNVSEEKRVPMTTLSFQGSAMHWWTSLMREKQIMREPSIKYWNELRSALRRRHIPKPSDEPRTSLIKCFKCFGRGHIASQCPTKKTMIIRGNEILSEESTSSFSSSSNEEDASLSSSEEAPCEEESKDLTSLTLATLFGKLREREKKLHIFEENEQQDKKGKGVSLRALKSVKGKEVCEESSCEDSKTENLNLLVKKFRKFLRKKRNSPYKFNKKANKKEEASTSSYNCFECGKPGHIKAECPNLLKKQQEWLLKAYMTGDPSKFSSLKLKNEGFVTYGDNNKGRILGHGNIVPHTLGGIGHPYCVLISSSPRFNMYGNEFGMGKALAVRSGYANKFDGKVTSYPGREGGGSIDLEVCLLPHTMSELESDMEFMNAVSVSNLVE